MADSKKYNSRVPSEYQEVECLQNSRTQYIDTGLLGSDMDGCELEIVMRNDLDNTSRYNFNGTYVPGSAVQFGLVATSDTLCRASMNFGFANAIITSDLANRQYHTLYVKSGLQKVDGITVGTLPFGTLNGSPFRIFGRNQPEGGVDIAWGMSLKLFTVKRNGQYIRNMIPVRRISDSVLGLYDAANDVFYTNQGTDTFTAGSDVNNWQHSLRKLTTATDTLTTLPADIYANGTTATVGVKGNMSQSGTPTPASPIYPSETGDKTANLYFKSIASVSIDASGKLIGNSQFICYVAKVEANKSYIGQVGYVYAFFDNEPVAGSQAYDSQRVVANASDGITSPIDGYVAVRCNTGATDVMLNEGTTILPYQPFGYQIPILSGGTTTNVYLGQVQSTRQIKKLVLMGNENFGEYTNPTMPRIGIYLQVMDMQNNMRNVGHCSHFASISSPSQNTVNGITFGASNNYIYITFSLETATALNLSDMESIKTWLADQYSAGTPVTVWYVLTTPQTTTLNEPIRKIGEYADTVSGISIPTITGADSFDVLTTLKPSEVELTYTGWHDASVKEWDGSEWQ